MGWTSAPLAEPICHFYYKLPLTWLNPKPVTPNNLSDCLRTQAQYSFHASHPRPQGAPAGGLSHSLPGPGDQPPVKVLSVPPRISETGFLVGATLRQGLGSSARSWPGLGAPRGAPPSPNLRLGDVRAGAGGVLPHLPCRWSRDSSFRVDFQELGPSRLVSPTWGADRRAAGPAFLAQGPRAVPASRLREKGLRVRGSGPCCPRSFVLP